MNLGLELTFRWGAHYLALISRRLISGRWELSPLNEQRGS